MIRIGEFSSLAKITVKALRFYDEIDLFKPSFVDDNGYRYYSIEQLEDLQRIVALRGIGVPIEQIKEILMKGNAVTVLKRRLDELQNERERIDENFSLTKAYLAKAEKGDFMKNYQAIEKTLPECEVYFRRGTIDSMEDLFPFVLEAGEEVRANNPELKCAAIDYCFISYSAGEYKERDVELEYVEAVERVGNESQNIKFRHLDAQKAICVQHKGAYSELGKAYAFAVNYVKEKGYEIAAPIRECYIDGCWNKDDEDEYLTEIQIPV